MPKHMQAVICTEGVLGAQLPSAIRHLQHTCTPSSFTTFHDQPPAVTGSKGFICVEADDLSAKGPEGAVSWITQLRIATAHPYRLWPVLIFGYRSHMAFLRSLRVPPMLASPGIEYVQLPFLLKELNQTVESLERAPVLSELVIDDYTADYDHVKRLGDHLAHTLGNFHAVFRLIEGAYQSGSLGEDEYLRLDLAVEEAMKDSGALSNYPAFQEFRYLRKRRAGRSQDPSNPQSKPIASGRKVLLIDDAASLGWAQTLSMLLLGKDTQPDSPLSSHFSQLRCDGFTAIGCQYPYDESGEIKFVAELLRCLKKPKGKELIDCADLIFLDIRLKRKSDESERPEHCSGIQVLRAIREVNAGVPIIMLTASRKASSLEAVLQAGADEYFVKDPGDAGESSETLKAYYQDFAETVQRVLRTTYRREIWNGIPKATSSEEVKFHLKRALAHLRKRPIRFEQERLGYSPYAAAIIELGSAMERFVECDSGKGDQYEAKVLERFRNNPVMYCIATTLGFIRNNAAHPLEQHNIVEADARIIFAMTLIAMDSSGGRIETIVGVGVPCDPVEAIREVVAYVLSRAAMQDGTPPFFNTWGHLSTILGGRGKLSAIVSFILAPTAQRNWESPEGHPYRIFLSAWLERFQTLTTMPANSVDAFMATTPPSILEAFYDQDARRWIIPDHSSETCNPLSSDHQFLVRNDGGYTQYFIKISTEVWIPWGPSIPSDPNTLKAMKDRSTNSPTPLPQKTVYVGNFAHGTTEQQLRGLFESFGTVNSAIAITDRYDRRPRGFGFVEMTTGEDAACAIQALNGSKPRLNGRELVVNLARP